MAMPTTTVEVAFATAPGAAPTWTDITAYLKTFTVRRGRQRQLDTFQAGRAQITLDNAARAFDPSYAASPYSPNVLPMRRIRIRAVWNAVTYDVFNGYVDSWDQRYSPPGDAECVVQATDAFKVLANVALPNSVYEREVRVDTPVLWWRLDEPSGSATVSDSSGNVRTGTVTGAGVASGGSTLIVRDPGGAATFTEVVNSNISGPVALSSAAPWAVEFWFQMPANPGFIDRYLSFDAGATTQNLFSLQLNNATRFFGLSLFNTAGTLYTLDLTGAVNAGQKYHAVITHDTDRFLRMYLDGVLVGTAATATTGSFNWTTATLGSNNAQAAPNAVIDEFAVYSGGASTALSTTRIAAHNTAGRTPWNGDLSGARVGRLLDAGGWPTADRNVDTGMAVLQSADLAATLLAALQSVELTEAGALFVTAAGLVRFIARDSLLKAPYTTSQGTFGDSGTELEYGDLVYQYDDQLIYNEVKVSRTNGTVQVVADTTSQTAYLRRTRTLTGLLHQSDSISLDRANWELVHYKDPILRTVDVVLEPAAGNDTTHFPHALGRELMERVTVLRRPQNLGAAIQQDALIEGIVHDVSAVRWKTTWNLSPADAQAYWILGTAGFSELEQTTRLGF